MSNTKAQWNEEGCVAIVTLIGSGVCPNRLVRRPCERLAIVYGSEDSGLWGLCGPIGERTGMATFLQAVVHE